MTPFDLVPSLFSLVIFGGLIWGVFSLMLRASRAERLDPAVIARQVATYGLAFIALSLSGWGVSWVLEQAVDAPARLSNAALAEGLALLALGLPLFTMLLVWIDRRLRADEAERTSIAWSVYLSVVVALTLTMTVINAYLGLETVIDPDDSIEWTYVLKTLNWGSFLAVHWFFLLRRHGVRGDLHLALATVVALVPLGVGQAGMLRVLGDVVYDELTGRTVTGVRDAGSTWIALFVVGAATWIAVWLRHYESAPRTTTWLLTVVPVGALIGFVAALVAGAQLLYTTVVWFIGDPSAATASAHFDSVPFAAAVILTGGASWLYHRAILGHPARDDVIRSYDYLLMFASLVAAAVGAIIVLAAVFDDGGGAVNTGIAGATVLLVGGATWSYRVGRIIETYRTVDDHEAEVRSTVRRVYLYGTLGVSTFAMLIAGVMFLQGIFEDLLDGTLRGSTFTDNRVQLATMLVVGVILGLHAVILRGDRNSLGSADPDPMPPPPRASAVGSSPNAAPSLG